MANVLETSASRTAATAVALAALAGCGGATGHGSRSTSSATDDAVAAAAAAAADAEAVPDLDPAVGGHELMRLKRVGWQMGTSDLVKYGSDGSVVVIQAYGGGGERIKRCTLGPGELARLRADLRQLPLDRPKPRQEPARPTFYTKPPAQYTFMAGKLIQTFTQVEMPRDARPLVRRLVRTLSGHVARCRTMYRTRS